MHVVLHTKDNFIWFEGTLVAMIPVLYIPVMASCQNAIAKYVISYNDI